MIVTQEEALNFLDLNGLTAIEETIITQLVSASQNIVENYLGRNFESEEFTEEFQGKDQKVIELKNFPVDSTADFNLYIRSGNDDFSDDDLVDSGNYTVDYKNGSVRYLGGIDPSYVSQDSFGDGTFYNNNDFCGPINTINQDLSMYQGFPVSNNKNIKVVYTAGYANENIPDAIKIAILFLTQIMWSDRDQETAGLSSMKADDTNVKYDNDMNDPIPRKIKMLIDPYRNVVI